MWILDDYWRLFPSSALVTIFTANIIIIFFFIIVIHRYHLLYQTHFSLYAWNDDMHHGPNHRAHQPIRTTLRQRSHQYFSFLSPVSSYRVHFNKIYPNLTYDYSFLVVERGKLHAITFQNEYLIKVWFDLTKFNYEIDFVNQDKPFLSFASVFVYLFSTDRLPRFHVTNVTLHSLTLTLTRTHSSWTADVLNNLSVFGAKKVLLFLVDFRRPTSNRVESCIGARSTSFDSFTLLSSYLI